MAEEIVGAIICRKRGDTAPDKITVLDSESAATPKDPLDITNFSYKLTVNTERDPEPVGPPIIGVELVSITGTITDALGGVVEFPWTSDEADQVADTFWYDIEQVDAGGRVKTIAKNKYIFFQDIGKTN